MRGSRIIIGIAGTAVVLTSAVFAVRAGWMIAQELRTPAPSFPVSGGLGQGGEALPLPEVSVADIVTTVLTPTPEPSAPTVPAAVQTAPSSPMPIAQLPPEIQLVVPLTTSSSAAATVEDDEDGQTTVVAVGDIMLSRDVGSTIRRKKSVDYPYMETRGVISTADIAFANLETSVTPGDPVPTASMSFRADPDTLTGLAAAGFDIVSLANNHTPNYGQAGLSDTFKYLAAAGIEYAGAGPDDAAAHQPAIIERNGIRFAFLAYNDADVVPGSYFAAEDRAGTAKMDVARAAADIAAARERADVVIVSMHSGHEYKYDPNARQTAFARTAVDAGADLVLGHHAHVVQSAEWYKGKLIFYGLGNFVFDQMWSMATRRGLMPRLTFDGSSLVSVELFVVQIENYAQPRLIGGKEAASVLQLLRLPMEEANGTARLVMP